MLLYCLWNNTIIQVLLVSGSLFIPILLLNIFQNIVSLLWVKAFLFSNSIHWSQLCFISRVPRTNIVFLFFFFYVRGFQPLYFNDQVTTSTSLVWMNYKHIDLESGSGNRLPKFILFSHLYVCNSRWWNWGIDKLKFTKVFKPVYASVSSSMKWNSNTTHLIVFILKVCKFVSNAYNHPSGRWHITPQL